jgi:hypothetical protein
MHVLGSFFAFELLPMVVGVPAPTRNCSYRDDAAEHSTQFIMFLERSQTIFTSVPA